MLLVLLLAAAGLLLAPQAAASGAFSWVVFYAFRSVFWRGLDNLSRLPADRAGKAKERAQEKLAKGGLSDKEYKIVEAKLQRALVRLSVKS